MIPITKRFDVSGAIMNGTSIVGFSNFLGVSRSKHQIISGTLGIELLPKRPGGLRIEVSALKGSLLPLMRTEDLGETISTISRLFGEWSPEPISTDQSG